MRSDAVPLSVTGQDKGCIAEPASRPAIARPSLFS